ncbi:MAG TPA: hypothetical protein VNX00_07870 [Herbaspirillum sp.]|nr:hypothetical protein [Herbaspirillum sp.]
MQVTKHLLSVAFTGAILLQTFPAAAAGNDDGPWQAVKDRISTIANDGDDSIYLSGWAHHGRNTYSREKLDQLNEKSWGGGYGRTYRNASGNDESLYFMAISDSHKKLQLMSGYAYEWIYPIANTGLEAGVGYTAMLMSRQDYFSGAPFPIALPLASIGTRSTKLMMSYVPRLSQNKGNGDVLYMFLRVEFR